MIANLFDFLHFCHIVLAGENAFSFHREIFSIVKTGCPSEEGPMSHNFSRKMDQGLRD